MRGRADCGCRLSYSNIGGAELEVTHLQPGCLPPLPFSEVKYA